MQEVEQNGEYGSSRSMMFMTFFSESVRAKALYTYAANGADELSFTEGDELAIIDQTEEDWWKTERDGIIFIVPAAYLEVIGG